VRVIRTEAAIGLRPSIFRMMTNLALRDVEALSRKRLGSIYRSGKCKDRLMFKNPVAPAVKREAEEDWGKERWR
jgi:hypothetical protein